MTCDIGRLHAYLDNVLSSDERTDVDRHLATCATCRAELEALRGQEQRMTIYLNALEPAPRDVPSAREALARFRAQVQPAASDESAESDLLSPWSRIQEWIAMTMNRRWRPVAFGAAVLLAFVVLFSFAPAREAAAQFLGVFRVRKFAVIPVDPAQVAQLEDLGEQIDAGVLGESTMLREMGDPQSVESADEAEAIAGFDVRTPETGNLTLREFGVVQGPAMRVEITRDTLQMLAGVAGVDDIQLPDAQSVTIEADFPMMVLQTYGDSGESVEFLQMPSPSVTIPEGIDPAAYGEVLLRLLGTPADDAQRLASTIDWTSTLVIPFPTDVGSFREVSVNGTTAVLLEQERTNSRRYERNRLLLWEQDDIVYSLNGTNVDASELVRMAESLQ